MTTSVSRDKIYIGIALALFGLLVFVHVACGDFPKAIDVLPDERRYIETARSLFSGNGLIIRGAESSFQKILYPVALFPALLFEDGYTQVQVIGLLNSIYAASSVFPVLAIARKLFDDFHLVVACMACAAFIPDLMYSMTFMSEPLFMPLSLWTVYLCWRCFQMRGVRAVALAGGAGLLVYAVYLCKEVALMYAIAFVAWQVCAAVRKTRPVKEAIASAAAFLFGFAVPFAIMKLTLFSGLGNSYSQFSFDILLSPYTVLFGFYALVVEGIHFVVAFGVFPVLFCALCFREFTREDRDLTFFCLLSLAVGLAVVIFTISMREDVGHVALRPHLRYVAPLAPVLLMLFAKLSLDFDPRAILASRRRTVTLAASVTGVSVLVLLLFGSANYRQGFDFSQFHVLRWLLEQTGEVDYTYYDSARQTYSAIGREDGALLEIVWVVALVRVLVVTFTIGGTMLLLRRKRSVRKVAARGMCALIVVFMALNSVALFVYNRDAYDVDPDDIAEVCTLSDELGLLATPGKHDIAVVLDNENTGANNLIDTYLQDGAGTYSYLLVGEMEQYARYQSSKEDFDPDEIAAIASVAYHTYRYVLVNAEQEIDFGELDLFPLMGGEGSRFILYEIIGT